MLAGLTGLLGGGARGGGASFESIATQTAAGGETTITFSSIPSTYKHLQIRGISRRNAAGGFANSLRFNGDTGTNYTYGYLRGDGAAASTTHTTGATFIIGTTSSSATYTAGTFGAVIFDIQDYSSTSKYKTAKGLGGFDANTTGRLDLASGLWLNTNAITSVSLYFQGDAAAAGSTFALYGIKG